MVSILSPPFVKSAGCRKQVESFWHSTRSGDTTLTNSSRIFKVVKRPVPVDEIPDSLPTAKAVATFLLKSKKKTP